MRFRTTIVQSGKTTTGIQVPDAVVEALGSGKRPAVKVTVNGYSYRSTVASMGGVFMVSLSAEHRAGAGVVARPPGHRGQVRGDPAAPDRQVGRDAEAGSPPLTSPADPGTADAARWGVPVVTHLA
jgi:hypothetical protein